MEEMVTRLVDAAFQGQWVVVGGAALMLLVAAAQWLSAKFKKRIPNKAMPWVSAVIGTVGGIGMALLTAKIIWWKAALGGLMVGATASGLWSLLGKHFLKGMLEDDDEE